MRKRYNNCSHGMSARTIYSVFAAAATVMAVMTVRAEEQLDLIGPPGAFEEAVALMMIMNKGMTRDVAEMLVAADALRENSDDDDPESSGNKLRSALEAMDDLQRDAAELFDQSYDDYLDLYPLWRMYVLCEDPVLREQLFIEYRALLERYELNRRELMEDLGFLLSLEQALMPSNAYADPSDRIPATMNTSEILRDFDAVQPTDEDDEEVVLPSL